MIRKHGTGEVIGTEAPEDDANESQANEDAARSARPSDAEGAAGDE